MVESPSEAVDAGMRLLYDRWLLYKAKREDLLREKMHHPARTTA